MARILSKMAPWLSPAARPHPAAGHAPAADPVRVLDHGDTGQLRTLVNRDPVANIFLASHLEATRSAAPTAAGGHVLGYFDGPELTAACWSGANIVPVEAAGRPAKAFGQYLAHSGKSFSSIFGPASAVLPLWTELECVAPTPFDVRRNQPLMALSEPPAVEPHPGLRFSTMDDFESLLPACVAMFEEEVGYSPLIGGEAHYKQRIASFIHRGHSMVDYDDDGKVIFKAELGSVSAHVTQIQGVWMNPAYRGKGLSASYLAAVVELAQQYATTTSLYVNDYNAPAMATYLKVGFERVGAFATILF